MKKTDLIGQKINHWTVLRQTDRKNGSIMYECMCDCELKTIRPVRLSALLSGKSRGCGVGSHRVGFYKKNFNEFIIEGNIAKIFYKEYFCIIDTEDLDKISHTCWFAHIDHQGNIRWESKKSGLLHRVIMNAPKDAYIDHINGDTNDNRKENLRIATACNNSWNTKLSSKNTSGFKGVDKNYNAYINYKGIRYKLGKYSSIEEGIYARYYAEMLLYKDFSSIISREIKAPSKPINYQKIETHVTTKLKKKGLTP